MALTFKDDFIDRIKAEGRAEGRAEGTAEGRAEAGAEWVLRMLTGRGVEVPAELRERVLSCTDFEQISAWFDKASTATSIKDVFPD
jgi:predicted transposase YdaD